jgi:hypothetical protein
VSRLFNDGSGHFAGLVSTFVPDPLSRTWVADLNGDGRLDILTGHWAPIAGGTTFNTKPCWWLAGIGGGAFGPPVSTGLTQVMALGAFSGPGSLDAVVYGPSSSGYGIAHGLGDGTFAAPEFTAGSKKAGFANGWGAPIDLDGDGRDELLVSIDSTPGTYAVLHVGAGLSLLHSDVLRGYLGLVPVVADLDGDGHLDAVLSQMRVALNRDGRLGGLRTLEGALERESDLNTQDADAGDLDGNGTADILVTLKHAYGGSFVGLRFMSNHDGTFEKGVSWQAETYIRQTVLADLNGDGRLDALELHNDPGLTNHLYTAINDGSGNFAVSATLSIPSVYLSPGSVVPADFDGDSDTDAIAFDVVGSVTLMFLNDGLGNFTQQTCSLPTTGTYGHVDGDALPARFTTSGDSLSVQRATAVGVLGPPTFTPLGATLVSARFADVNGDGLTDAVCLVNGNQVETFLGQPGGGWGPPFVSPEAAIPSGDTPVFTAIGDLDGDGRPDLVFTNGGGLVSVLRNLGGGGFGERGVTVTSSIIPPMVADVDGDGAGDLVGLTRAFYSHDSQGNLDLCTTDVLFGAAPAPIPTPALVSLVSASATLDRAKLSWFVPSDGPATLIVERRRDAGAWSAIASVTPAGGLATYEDRAVEPGATYSWRLAWSEGGATKHSDLASLTIPARPGFAIRSVRPNPADGERVWVTLAVDRAAPLELSLVDVAGRVVARRRVESTTPGSVTLALETPGLRAGIYFVRATQNAGHASATLVRLR